MASLLANNIELPFQTYFDLFVLYLIVKNTSRVQEEKKNSDASGKDVPSMVFLRNQQYLKDVMKTEMKDREKKK